MLKLKDFRLRCYVSVDVTVCQVAQEVALSTGETGFLLKLLEAAGDIFFNSCQDRHKAIPFYRVQYALPTIMIPALISVPSTLG